MELLRCFIHGLNERSSELQIFHTRLVAQNYIKHYKNVYCNFQTNTASKIIPVQRLRRVSFASECTIGSHQPQSHQSHLQLMHRKPTPSCLLSPVAPYLQINFFSGITLSKNTYFMHVNDRSLNTIAQSTILSMPPIRIFYCTAVWM